MKHLNIHFKIVEKYEKYKFRLDNYREVNDEATKNDFFVKTEILPYSEKLKFICNILF